MVAWIHSMETRDVWFSSYLEVSQCGIDLEAGDEQVLPEAIRGHPLLPFVGLFVCSPSLVCRFPCLPFAVSLFHCLPSHICLFKTNLGLHLNLACRCLIYSKKSPLCCCFSVLNRWLPHFALTLVISYSRALSHLLPVLKLSCFRFKISKQKAVTPPLNVNHTSLTITRVRMLEIPQKM